MNEGNRQDPGPVRHGDKPSADMKTTGAFMRQKRLLAGLGWNTLGQLVVVGIPLGFTPFLLHQLGATDYGVFALVSSLRGLLSNLDGGLGPTGTRYFPVYVGRGNGAITSSFLFTILTLTAALVGVEAIAIVFFAPTVAEAFAHGPDLSSHSHEIVLLIRDLMPAMFIAALRAQFQRLLMAHHRWAFVNYVQVVAVVAYTIIVIAISRKTPGFKCLIWGTYTQEAILIFSVVLAGKRYISLEHFRWLPISVVRQILHYGWRVQVAALASSFNYEIDALLVGGFFPIKDVAYYSIGANFSQQVANVPTNGLNPISQEIGRSYGKNGKQGVLSSFPSTQRMWVTAVGIFPIIAAVEGWFGVQTWLGPGSQVAAASATLLVSGFAPLLYNSIVDVTAKAVGMPEIESWYLGIGVIINVACTVPLALILGVLGVPLGTAIGEIFSFFICIFLARKKIGREIAPFYWDVNYIPAAIATGLAAVCEWLFGKNLPTGGVGFVLSGLLTLPAFVAYYGWVYRETLLRKLGFGMRLDGGLGRRPGEMPSGGNPAAENDGAYTHRQLRGLQALLAIAEPDLTSRQLWGLQTLMAIAEPEMAAVPFAGTPVRLRYTGPLEPAFERTLNRPPRAGVTGRQ